MDITTDTEVSRTDIEVFNEIVKARRSVRVYDQEKEYKPEIVQRSLEKATLAPNSSNMQLWEFYRVRDEEKRRELAEYCLNQSAARTARELVVFVTRPDKWKQRAKFNYDTALQHAEDEESKQKIKSYYGKLVPFMYRNDRLGLLGMLKKLMVSVIGLFRVIPREVTRQDVRIVTHKSAALAAQTFMLGVKAQGYDTCPMEGFDSRRVKKMMKLPAKAEINMIISVGPAAENGIYGPRFRVPNEEVIFSE